VGLSFVLSTPRCDSRNHNQHETKQITAIKKLFIHGSFKCKLASVISVSVCNEGEMVPESALTLPVRSRKTLLAGHSEKTTKIIKVCCTYNGSYFKTTVFVCNRFEEFFFIV